MIGTRYRFRVIETAMFFRADSDDEEWASSIVSEDAARKIAQVINHDNHPSSARTFKVVELPYDLKRGAK